MNFYYNNEIRQAKNAGEKQLWFNTFAPTEHELKDLISEGYRIFVRAGNDYYGYPLVCIYWGEEQEPKFNISESDKIKMFEFKNEYEYEHKHKSYLGFIRYIKHADPDNKFIITGEEVDYNMIGLLNGDGYEVEVIGNETRITWK